MAKYYWGSKETAINNIDSLLEALQGFCINELEANLDKDLIEVEMDNTISFTPQLTKLVRAIKILKDVRTGLENGEYVADGRTDGN